MCGNNNQITVHDMYHINYNKLSIVINIFKKINVVQEIRYGKKINELNKIKVKLKEINLLVKRMWPMN